jgi:hypothetical protein
MTWEAVQIAIVGAPVAVVFLGFVRERLPPDVVAMLAFSVLLAAGILWQNRGRRAGRISRGIPVGWSGRAFSGARSRDGGAQAG